MPEARHRRALVAQLSLPRRAGPADRLSAGGAALVETLAHRRGDRHHGRAALSRLDHRRGTAAALLSARSCRLTGRPRRNGRRRASSGRRCYLNERGLGAERGDAGRRCSVRSPATAGTRLRPLGRLWRQLPGHGDRPAPRGRPGACASTRRRWTRTSTLLGAPELDLLSHRRRAACQSRRAALRCLSGRHLGADDLRRAQSQPSRQPRASRALPGRHAVPRQAEAQRFRAHRYRRAIASGWRSPTSIGRSCGRSRSCRRCRSRPARAR